jgi:spore coat polysaccharide biosynthesis protein SpsF (cytidylyltransferase family)
MSILADEWRKRTPTRVVAIVQARMSSSRLPGKIVKPLAGRPALERLMERVARARTIDEHLVATSSDPSDDEVEALCKRAGIRCERGSLEDVLLRYHSAAIAASADVVVRITGDCPLIDPAIIDACVTTYQGEKDHVDYVSNVDERTYPDGLDVEVFPFAALDEATRHAKPGPDREHVTPWIRRTRRKRTVSQPVNLGELRLTLDYADDYTQIASIYETLFPKRPDFDSREVYQLLAARPELIRTASRAALSEADQKRFATILKEVLP